MVFLLRFQQLLVFLQYSMHLTVKSSAISYRLTWMQNQDNVIYFFARTECSCFAVWENLFYYFFFVSVSVSVWHNAHSVRPATLCTEVSS
jgi:hypothetical protein